MFRHHKPEMWSISKQSIRNNILISNLESNNKLKSFCLLWIDFIQNDSLFFPLLGIRNFGSNFTFKQRLFLLLNIIIFICLITAISISIYIIDQNDKNKNNCKFLSILIGKNGLMENEYICIKYEQMLFCFVFLIIISIFYAIFGWVFQRIKPTTHLDEDDIAQMYVFVKSF